MESRTGECHSGLSSVQDSLTISDAIEETVSVEDQSKQAAAHRITIKQSNNTTMITLTLYHTIIWAHHGISPVAFFYFSSNKKSLR
jgi:hypothetical protein